MWGRGTCAAPRLPAETLEPRTAHAGDLDAEVYKTESVIRKSESQSVTIFDPI